MILYVSEISLEYSKRAREVALEITRAISESLLLEPEYIYNTMNMDRGLQLLAGNYYPPCPQPEHAIGLPPHTDPGLFTMLIQNDLNGLQVEHNGKWLSVTGPKNCYFVNLADQMQVLLEILLILCFCERLSMVTFTGTFTTLVIVSVR